MTFWSPNLIWRRALRETFIRHRKICFLFLVLFGKLSLGEVGSSLSFRWTWRVGWSCLSTISYILSPWIRRSSWNIGFRYLDHINYFLTIEWPKYSAAFSDMYKILPVWVMISINPSRAWNIELKLIIYVDYDGSDIHLGKSKCSCFVFLLGSEPQSFINCKIWTITDYKVWLRLGLITRTGS